MRLARRERTTLRSQIKGTTADDTDEAFPISFLIFPSALSVSSAVKSFFPGVTFVRSAKKRSPRLRTRAAAAKNQFNPKTPYGLGGPGMVFGRVARWTIRPTIGTNQPKTTTSVLFGDWRRAESFMIQIAIQSQMATEIRIGINITPQAAAKIPAAALSLSSIGVGLAVASSWARRAVAVRNSGRQEMSRFIRGLITDFLQRVSTQ
jgi:hypothetical protein